MKKYLYKIYDVNGDFITTWNDVATEPDFSVDINGGYSEMTVRLSREVFNFGENQDVAYGNRVKVYCFDTDSGQNGVCVYSGFISRYVPIIEGRKETIEITLVSWWWELARYLLEGDGTGIDSQIYGNGYGVDLVTTMTSNSDPSPFVALASSEANASNMAYMAFNSNLADKWAANATTGWLRIYLGTTAKNVRKYTVTALASGQIDSGLSPKNWTFEGSNDGTSWTVLDTQKNQQDWFPTEVRSYEIENENSYKYYRINISANNGHSTYVQIAELDIMEGVAFSRTGATSIKYVSKEPSAILKDILDKFTTAGGLLDYGVGTVVDTSAPVTYQFNTATVQEALQKVVEISPEDWYFRIGADDLVYFDQKGTEPDHKFYIGRNVRYYKQEKRLENIVNYIYFTGNGFFKKYSNTSSESAYGRYSQKITDDRVTNVETANAMADAILSRMATPEIRITIDVIDNNNADSKGYDIESIKVGDVCKIFNATSKGDNLWDSIVWDVDSWDFDITNSAGTVLQIQKIEYHPDYVRLEISNRQPDVAKRIEDINSRLVDSLTANNSVIPE